MFSDQNIEGWSILYRKNVKFITIAMFEKNAVSKSGKFKMFPAFETDSQTHMNTWTLLHCPPTTRKDVITVPRGKQSCVRITFIVTHIFGHHLQRYGK